jgi:hypothetical protein
MRFLISTTKNFGQTKSCILKTLQIVKLAVFMDNCLLLPYGTTCIQYIVGRYFMSLTHCAAMAMGVPQGTICTRT